MRTRGRQGGGGAAGRQGGREAGGIVTDVQCKTCSIKVPTQDITWCVPEGGGGPKYSKFSVCNQFFRISRTKQCESY